MTTYQRSIQNVAKAFHDLIVSDMPGFPGDEILNARCEHVCAAIGVSYAGGIDGGSNTIGPVDECYAIGDSTVTGTIERLTFNLN